MGRARRSPPAAPRSTARSRCAAAGRTSCRRRSPRCTSTSRATWRRSPRSTASSPGSPTRRSSSSAGPSRSPRPTAPRPGSRSSTASRSTTTTTCTPTRGELLRRLGRTAEAARRLPPGARAGRTTTPSGACSSAGWPSSAPRLAPVYARLHRRRTAAARARRSCCLHGFMDTWRTWELVLPALERHHDVLAPTLPGHAGGPPLEGELERRADRRRGRARDGRRGLRDRAHRRQLARAASSRCSSPRAGGRESVVAFAPAGGWARGRRARWRELLASQAPMHEQARATAPHAEAIVASAEGRRRATQLIVTNFEHIPAELHRPPAARRRELHAARPR